MSRSTFKKSEKRRWVSRFQGHGTSAAAFCREFDLPYGSFMAWKRLYSDKRGKARLVAPAEAQPPFIEVTCDSPVSHAEGEASPMPVAELSLGSGVMLRIFTPSHGKA